MSGTVVTGGNGTSTRRVSGTQFAQYTAFISLPYSTSFAYTWRFPGYSIYDPYPAIDIGNAQVLLGWPPASRTTYSWYGAALTGPSYANPGGFGTYNGYLAMCGIDTGGNAAGIAVIPMYPAQGGAN